MSGETTGPSARLTALWRRYWKPVEQPFDVTLAVAGFVYGIPVLLGLTRPSSLARQVAPWMLHAWAAAVLAASALVLLAWHRTARADTEDQRESAARIESLGLSLSGATYTMYALSALASGGPGVTAGTIMAGIAAGYVLRTRTISITWEGQRAARRQLHRRAPGPYA